MDYFIINNWVACRERCDQQTECSREYFTMNREEWVPPDVVIKETYELTIDFPIHSTTIYETSLNMSFEEYLCLIASILSLWFGFSVIHLPEICQKIFRMILIINQTKNM